jgi:predicted PurR-regulated permease PerM
MIKPYILALLSAFIISYLVKPIHSKLEKRMSNKIAAIGTILIFFLIIGTPIMWTFKEVIFQGYSLIESGSVEKLVNLLHKIEFLQYYQIEPEINKIISLGINSLSGITVSIINATISLFIVLFGMFYMLTEWSSINSKIKNALPFPNKEKLSKDIAQTTNKIVHGTLFIAIIELIIATIGFWLADVNFFMLFAILTAMLAFIPGGPILIWGPIIVFKLLEKQYLNSTIILVIGIIISLYIDTILRARIVGKNTRIHPLIALIGILGGTSVFGILGIIIGPLFLSYAIRISEEILAEYD